MDPSASSRMLSAFFISCAQFELLTLGFCLCRHGLEDLRPVVRHRRWKTEKCKNFEKDGVCPYGSRCDFIHNEDIATLAATKRSGQFMFCGNGAGNGGNPPLSSPAQQPLSPGFSPMHMRPQYLSGPVMMPPPMPDSHPAHLQHPAVHHCSLPAMPQQQQQQQQPQPQLQNVGHPASISASLAAFSALSLSDNNDVVVGCNTSIAISDAGKEAEHDSDDESACSHEEPDAIPTTNGGDGDASGASDNANESSGAGMRKRLPIFEHLTISEAPKRGEGQPDAVGEGCLEEQDIIS